MLGSILWYYLVEVHLPETGLPIRLVDVESHCGRSPCHRLPHLVSLDDQSNIEQHPLLQDLSNFP